MPIIQAWVRGGGREGIFRMLAAGEAIPHTLVIRAADSTSQRTATGQRTGTPVGRSAPRNTNDDRTRLSYSRWLLGQRFRRPTPSYGSRCSWYQRVSIQRLNLAADFAKHSDQFVAECLVQRSE